VGCDRDFTPSHSAVVRTLNVTRGYMSLLGRLSEHALLEQWQVRIANTRLPCAILYYWKMIILPRQARDKDRKRRENEAMSGVS
jgi:hypothetical protein